MTLMLKGGNNMVENIPYKQRNGNLFLILGLLNAFIILFISGVIMLSLYQIINMKQAQEFLEIIQTLPFTPPYSILFYCITIMVVIFLIMKFRYESNLDESLQLLFFSLEVCLAILLMYILGFSTNAITLLLVADALNSFKEVKIRNRILALLVFLYLLSSPGFLHIFEKISFTTYMSVYNSNFQVVMHGINTALHTFNIILFIVYMISLIQVEVNEGRRVKQLNFRLNALNSKLKDFADISEKMGETRERNRLAREIHDTLGHTLTGLSVGIDAAIMINDVDQIATKKQLQVLSETARQGLTDVRRSVNKLRPDALENHNLKAALKKMIIDFELVSSASINFVFHLEDLKFSLEEEEVVYRVVQEGLTNAIRHGKAENIIISLTLDKENLIILIEDDGMGCSDIKDGFGLYHMRERIGKLNGTLRVYGHQGFVIIAEFKLRKDSQYD